MFDIRLIFILVLAGPLLKTAFNVKAEGATLVKNAEGVQYTLRGV